MLILALLFISSVFCGAPLYQNGVLIEDHYIVVFNDEVAETELSNEITNAKALYGDRLGHIYQHALKGYSAQLTGDELIAVLTNPNVKFVEVDQVMTAGACVTTTAGSWGQTRVAQEYLNLNGRYGYPSTAGEGVTAYVLDTGIFIQHVDFQGRASFGFKATASWTDGDSHGHGTHVSSTVAGFTYGIARKATLVTVKVLGDNGSGSNAGVIAGVDYTLGQYNKKPKPSVANMSLGGGFSAALNNAVTAAMKGGVVYSVAAGNDNNNACNYSPASCPTAITVGSTTVGVVGENSIDSRSSFSNYGSCVNVFGPGSDITAAWIGTTTATRTISGTSMASPHLCGLTALVLGENPSLGWSAVVDAVVGDATVGLISLNCGSNSVCLASPNKLGYNGCSV